MKKLTQYFASVKTNPGLQAFASLILTLILGRYCLSNYDHANYASIILFLCALGLTIFKSYQYLEQPSPLFSRPQIKGFKTYLEQDYLPWGLRVWTLAPLTFFFIIIFGMTLALPVGPLSDEGMILFMEGGCDWGQSNVFFFSKLGLLIAVNIAALIAMRYKIFSLLNFVPHFIVLIALMAVWINDTSCDAYYGHPQGNLSQMILEVSTLSILLNGIMRLFATKSSKLKIIGLFLANCLYVIFFYISISFSDHWTWTHTFITSGILLALRFLLFFFI